MSNLAYLLQKKLGHPDNVWNKILLLLPLLQLIRVAIDQRRPSGIIGLIYTVPLADKGPSNKKGHNH